ncbi:single-stranded DNA-binding protein [Croceiramulus getboli]|nr:single-stranded DNA-binding protein [Flavobacteriaceae bacterium YJPT1-3]
MNALRNKVQLIGHLGADPELLTLDSGTKVAKFSLATNTNFKNAEGEKVENTEWHRVVAYGKTAELFEKYTSKGQHIAIEGKLTTRSWETQSGEKRYVTEVVCNELLLLNKS